MYNANPNYEMDFMILKDVNEHMEGLFQRFSKLLPFRIDFAYRKDTPSFGHSCRHSMCIEMHRLLSETQTMLAGYYWEWNIRQTRDFIFILSATWMGNVTRNLIGYPGNWEISGGGSRKGRVIFTCAGLKTNTRCVSIT